VRKADRRHADPLVTVIVPFLNEKEVIEATYSRTAEALSALRFELIFVDDGSRDGSPEIVRRICLEDPRVRLLQLSRNFGHQIALSAGLDAATGDVAVFLDADLQDPPRLIPEMIEIWRGGADVVTGVRRSRPGEPWYRMLVTHLFYRGLQMISSVPLTPQAADFRLMDRTVIDQICGMTDRDRYLRGMVAWLGFNQVKMLYDREPRFGGTPKYTFSKLTRLGMDGILAFSDGPLMLFVMVAFVFGVAASACALAALWHGSGWLLAGLVLGAVGLQWLALGVLGEYLTRIYRSLRGRPLYVVAARSGFGSPESEHFKHEFEESET
jgi:dolichol-phosphate mannosyltransferase